MNDPKFTGLRCPECKRTVAVVEYETRTAMTFYCPGCGHRWVGYEDDGVSGAEFAKRPAFSRMMAALTRRGSPFQVLILSELSRLGREQLETGHALKLMSKAGVRIFSYLDGKELLLETAIDRFTLHAMNLAAELEREKSSQRAKDKARALVRAGHVPGGRCYGYDLVDVMKDGRRVVRSSGAGRSLDATHVEQQINEPQAAVIRQIFELAAAGHPQLLIVKRLNAERAAPPRPQRGRPAAWSPASVHEVLHRERYRGQLVWNKTRKRDQWGQRTSSPRRADEWLRVAQPELRIVSDELWKAAHTQISRAAAVSTFPKRWQHREAKYLLTGLARCTVCGGGMCVRTRGGRGAERTRTYACTSHFYRGASVCSNQLRVPVSAVEQAVLASVSEVLAPDVLIEVLTAVRDRLEHRRTRDPRAKLEAELDDVSAQVRRYVATIATAGDVEEIGVQLRGLQERRKQLQEALSSPIPSPLPSRINWRHRERLLRRKLEDWRGLLGRHVTQARPVLARAA